MSARVALWPCSSKHIGALSLAALLTLHMLCLHLRGLLRHRRTPLPHPTLASRRHQIFVGTPSQSRCIRP
jgi:hypothetical protein